MAVGKMKKMQSAASAKNLSVSWEGDYDRRFDFSKELRFGAAVFIGLRWAESPVNRDQ